MTEYYEVVFAEMVADGSLSLECVLFDPDQWYEVDTLEDLPGAEEIGKRIGKRIGTRIARPVRSFFPASLGTAETGS